MKSQVGDIVELRTSSGTEALILCQPQGPLLGYFIAKPMNRA